MTVRRALTLLVALAASGCGGGAGLMHPAHALGTDRTTFGAGVSSQFVLGESENHIDAARRAMVDGGVVTDEESGYVAGALAQTLFAPGLSPWFGARTGLGYTSDAGMTYTGRMVRVDGRHAFEADKLAFSAGLGLSYVMKRPSSDSSKDTAGASDRAVPGLDAGDVSGLGADIPLIVGWRSSADLFQIWAGARAGYERLKGNLLLSIDPNAQEAEQDPFEAYRWYTLGVLGFAVTIHPIVIALELDAGYQRGDGTLRRPGGPGSTTNRAVGGTIEGVTVTPTAVIIGRLWN